MVTLVEPSSSVSVAAGQAERNWSANLAALADSQPWVVGALGDPSSSVTWVFGRDGFLTAKDSQGRWWSGCSLPKRAGRTMLKELDLRGVVGGLLAPTHAGQVVAALEKLSARQAIIVIQPDADDLGVLLGCCDFSGDIRRNRLWFAIGREWPSMLTELFNARPGLSTPSQFIRTLATADELVQQLIPVAEKAFQDCNDSRATRIHLLQSVGTALADGTSTQRTTPGRAKSTYLLVAASHFRLWDDAGAALVSALGDARHLDPDDPAQSSALGLSLASGECRAVIVPNRSREDLPDVLRADAPVISWITHPRIPAFNAKHSSDALILADEAWLPLAKAGGWPDGRLRVAGWPKVALPPAARPNLVLIADTFTLDIPVADLKASSHHLLWELIRGDLSSDPFSLGEDVHGFITRRMAKLGIAEEGFDRALFIEKLIIPAYQQGLVRLLLDAGLPLKLFGEGWDQLPRLRSIWQGTVRSREAFHLAVECASVLIYPWPTRHVHLIDFLDRCVLFPHVRRAENWVRDAKAALKSGCENNLKPPLSASMIEELLGEIATTAHPAE